jgi:hypothetical protein
MDEEWKNIEDELKELENEFSADDDMIRQLSAPSAADYWKKRLEEEKSLYEKIIQTKEEEKKSLQLKLEQQKEQIAALEQKINNLEQTMNEEAQAWQERLKSKETELMLEKERVGWDEDLKKLQYEKKILEEDIERLKVSHQQEIENIISKHKKQLEELLATQNSLIENIESIDRELTEIKTNSTNQINELTQEKNRLSQEIGLNKQKIDELSQKNSELLNENSLLMEKLNYLNNTLEYSKKKYIEYVSFVLHYFTVSFRDYLGTILGIINYCYSKLRIPRVFRKQMMVMNDIVDKILQLIDRTLSFVQIKKLDIQEMYAERLINRLTDNIDTEILPPGLKLKVDFQQLRKVILPYIDLSYKIEIEYKDYKFENFLIFKLTIPDKIVINNDFVMLRNTIFLHNWDIITSFENNETNISISIPVFK